MILKVPEILLWEIVALLQDVVYRMNNSSTEVTKTYFASKQNDLRDLLGMS